RRSSWRWSSALLAARRLPLARTPVQRWRRTAAGRSRLPPAAARPAWRFVPWATSRPTARPTTRPARWPRSSVEPEASPRPCRAAARLRWYPGGRSPLHHWRRPRSQPGIERCVDIFAKRLRVDLRQVAPPGDQFGPVEGPRAYRTKLSDGPAGLGDDEVLTGLHTLEHV